MILFKDYYSLQGILQHHGVDVRVGILQKTDFLLDVVGKREIQLDRTRLCL